MRDHRFELFRRDVAVRGLGEGVVPGVFVQTQGLVGHRFRERFRVGKLLGRRRHG
jgi:hypothetical protein